MTTQKVIAILRAAGFTASKKVTITEDNTRRTELSAGYKVYQMGQVVAVECCHCQDQKDDILAALLAAGLNASELRQTGILKVQ